MFVKALVLAQFRRTRLLLYLVVGFLLVSLKEYFVFVRGAELSLVNLTRVERLSKTSVDNYIYIAVAP